MKTHLSILFFTSGLFLNGQALSGSMGPRDLSAPFKADKPITREEIRHRDRLETVTSPSIFQLASMDDQILKSKVSEFLSNYQIDEEMEVRLIDEMKLATGRHSLRYGFFWRDLPIYNLVLSDTIEGKIFLLLDDKLKEIAKTLGKVDEHGEVAEDLRTQILVVTPRSSPAFSSSWMRAPAGSNCFTSLALSFAECVSPESTSLSSSLCLRFAAAYGHTGRGCRPNFRRRGTRNTPPRRLV